MSGQELKTEALVLRRTNYGEADRIVNFITPEGQIAVMARGVRKTRSKLASGIELFCLSEINVHRGKGQLGTLTAARPLKFYRNLLTDFARMELAGSALKSLGKFEGIKSPAFFQIGKTVFASLDAGVDCDIVEAWLALRLAQARGEEVNLYCDVTGAPLTAETIYAWDAYERGLRVDPHGDVRAEQIKIMRLLVTSSPQLVAKIKNLPTLLPPVLAIARSL